jgi:site-specific DNA-methyltransferase (adenine-specific)
MSHICHLGDCLAGMATLADKSVDHVICDPPYEAEAHTKARRQSKGPGSIAEEYEIDFGQIDEATRTATADAAIRIARRWVMFFCQAEGLTPWKAAILAAGGKYKRSIVWVKPDSSPQFTGDRPAQAFEMIALGWAGPGRSSWNGGGKRGVYEFMVNNFGREGGFNSRCHPTQKPVGLMESIIRDFTDPGDLILDPFAGSGTTGVACKRLGRRFIGWELQEKYQRAAQARIDATHEQLELVRVKGPKAKQGAFAL